MRWRAVSVMAVVLAAATVAGAADRAGDRSMRLYRDPVTGAVGVPPPAAAERAVEPPSAAGAPAAPLREEAVRGIAGGVKVNLGGRLRAAVTRQPGGAHLCEQDGGAAHE